MKILLRGVAAVALTSALAASAGLAVAQAPPQGQGPNLPSLLHLRPDQMAAYQAIDAASKESPAVMASMRAKAQRLASETTPQRIDFEVEALNLRVALTHRVWDAERKFYAILTPEQQRTLDQVTAPHPQAQR